MLYKLVLKRRIKRRKMERSSPVNERGETRSVVNDVHKQQPRGPS
jgi:hypothetical protein